MRKKHLLIMVILGIATLFAVASIHAAATAPDEITMKNKAYKKHKKGIVKFSHKKHAVDYKAACGECHHDKDGKPLDQAALDAGNPGDAACIKCHTKIDKKDPKFKKMKKAQKIKEYFEEAVHANCKGCHKKFNKGKKPKVAPEKCTECHPKLKK